MLQHLISPEGSVHISIFKQKVPHDDVSCGQSSRLITCEADKSLKIWKENPLANEDAEPIDMAGWTKQCLALKRY